MTMTRAVVLGGDFTGFSFHMGVTHITVYL